MTIFLTRFLRLGHRGRCICTEYNYFDVDCWGFIDLIDVNVGRKIRYRHCGRAKYLHFLLFDGKTRFSMHVCVEYSLQCTRCIRLHLITGGTPTLHNSPGARRCRAGGIAHSNEKMKICKPALLCLPLACTHSAPCRSQITRKISLEIAIDFQDRSGAIPFKATRAQAFRFSLSIHESSVCLFVFTLKGFRFWFLDVCMCQKNKIKSACANNCSFVFPSARVPKNLYMYIFIQACVYICRREVITFPRTVL